MVVVACAKCGTKNRVDPARATDKQPTCGKCGAQLALKPDEILDKPITVTDGTFETAVLGVRNKPVLLDAWAPWCGPCRMVAPALEQLAAESKGRYVVAKLNVDENPRVAEQFRIQSIPTLLIFKNGQLVDRLIGAQPKDVIARKLANIA